jgi:hypothetical protein
MATLDTLQTAVNELTASTTTLLDEVNINKSTLTASAANAASSATASATSASSSASSATAAVLSAGNAAVSASAAATSAAQAASIVGFPPSMTGRNGFVLAVNDDATGVEWRPPQASQPFGAAETFILGM